MFGTEGFANAVKLQIRSQHFRPKTLIRNLQHEFEHWIPRSIIIQYFSSETMNYIVVATK